MSPYERINAYRPGYRSPGPWRRRFSAALPWVFVLGVAAGTMLPVRHGGHWLGLAGCGALGEVVLTEMAVGELVGQ